MKKAVKNTISVILAVAIFIMTGIFLRYLLYNDTKTNARLLFHDLHESEENIDTVFVGSSHVFRSLNPLITDELLGENTFNLGTSAQRIDGSYAIIKEACASHDIKHIYLEMYNWAAWDHEPFSDRTDMTATYEVSDFMQSFTDKVEFLLHSSSPKYYSNGFILARRNWEKIFDTKYITDLFELKQSERYRSNEWVWIDGKDKYIGKGYLASEKKLKKSIDWWPRAYGEVSSIYNIKENGDWRHTMLSIIDFCSKKGIELTLFIAPEPEAQIYGKYNYQEYIDTVRELADEYGLEFYDFNLIKKELFDTSDISLFLDEDHLNDKGATLFSTIFGQFFSGQLSESEIFYSSVDEKKAASEPGVYGMTFPEKDFDGYVNPYVISNRDEGIEYKIEVVSKEDGENIYYQDFDENNMIWLEKDASAEIKVTWRCVGSLTENEFSLDYPKK